MRPDILAQYEWISNVFFLLQKIVGRARSVKSQSLTAKSHSPGVDVPMQWRGPEGPPRKPARASGTASADSAGGGDAPGRPAGAGGGRQGARAAGAGGRGAEPTLGGRGGPCRDWRGGATVTPGPGPKSWEGHQNQINVFDPPRIETPRNLEKVGRDLERIS